jgi:transmembrane protein 216
MGLSSLPLQILLYFNRWLTLFYCIIELGSMIYKGVLLPYPPGVYGGELTWVILYGLVEIPRNFLGTNLLLLLLT